MMADDKTQTTSDEQAAEPAAEAATGNDATAATDDPPSGAPEADGPDAAAEAAELKAKLLHTLADMENLRRRTEREVADARKYAVSNFAREMLNVADNLTRALDAVPDSLRSGDSSEAKALIEGVEMTQRGLEQSLEKFGVAKIETKGQKFDPDFHQAMMEVDDPDAEPGTVAMEIQAGYAIGERVLRPAFVSVVKKRRAAPEPGPQGGQGGDAA